MAPYQSFVEIQSPGQYVSAQPFSTQHTQVLRGAFPPQYSTYLQQQASPQMSQIQLQYQQHNQMQLQMMQNQSQPQDMMQVQQMSGQPLHSSGQQMQGSLIMQGQGNRNNVGGIQVSNTVNFSNVSSGHNQAQQTHMHSSMPSAEATTTSTQKSPYNTSQVCLVSL